MLLFPQANLRTHNAPRNLFLDISSIFQCIVSYCLSTSYKVGFLFSLHARHSSSSHPPLSLITFHNPHSIHPLTLHPHSTHHLISICPHTHIRALLHSHQIHLPSCPSVHTHTHIRTLPHSHFANPPARLPPCPHTHIYSHTPALASTAQAGRQTDG